jgi:hypothetical protein
MGFRPLSTRELEGIEASRKKEARDASAAKIAAEVPAAVEKAVEATVDAVTLAEDVAELSDVKPAGKNPFKKKP